MATTGSNTGFIPQQQRKAGPRPNTGMIPGTRFIPQPTMMPLQPPMNRGGGVLLQTPMLYQYNPAAAAAYQYMANMPPQVIQTPMPFLPQGGYTQPTPIVTAPAQYQKRERKPLLIVDPNTKKEVQVEPQPTAAPTTATNTPAPTLYPVPSPYTAPPVNITTITPEPPEPSSSVREEFLKKVHDTLTRPQTTPISTMVTVAHGDHLLASKQQPTLFADVSGTPGTQGVAMVSEGLAIAVQGPVAVPSPDLPMVIPGVPFPQVMLPLIPGDQVPTGFGVPYLPVPEVIAATAVMATAAAELPPISVAEEFRAKVLAAVVAPPCEEVTSSLVGVEDKQPSVEPLVGGTLKASMLPEEVCSATPTNVSESDRGLEVPGSTEEAVERVEVVEMEEEEREEEIQGKNSVTVQVEEEGEGGEDKDHSRKEVENTLSPNELSDGSEKEEGEVDDEDEEEEEEEDLKKNSIGASLPREDDVQTWSQNGQFTKPKSRHTVAGPGQQDGKIRYNREYLLQFRSKDECQVPPAELLNKDCFKRNDYQQQHHGGGGGGGGGGRRGSRQGDRNEPRKIIAHAAPEKVELKKAEQPWQRQSDLQVELTEEEKETKEVFRKFQSILNKLTPQKFTKLADMTLQLKINTEERLRGVIDKIFTKALEETSFSEVYANLCRVLAPVRIDTEKEGKPHIITFRRLLLTKCQQEFEKDKQEDEEREAMQKGVEAAETEEIRKQRQQELEAAEITSRHRSLGNIRFIGELYKLKILSESIMHECMIRLLKSASDEESLECFAKLMATTGKDLDKEEAKQRIDTYFSRVNDIIKKGKISSRIRFALQDVVDLRENNWVPRQRQESQVKTIDQIHREAQDEEQLTKQMASQYVGGSGGMYGRRDSRPVDDKRRGSKPGPGGEEWSKVEKRPQQSRPDLERIRSIKKPGDKEKESSGLRAVSKWGNKGAATTSVAPEALRQIEKLTKPPLRSSSGGGGSKKPDKAPAMAAAAKVSPSALPPRRSSTHPEEKAAVLQAVKEMTSGTAQKKSGDPAPDQSSELDEETVTKRTENIIGELCENKDLKEAVECVKEMQSPGLLHVFVSETIKYSLENTSECRKLVGQLFHKLLQDGTLALDRMVAGLGDILEAAEDIEIDVPKIWDYIGELLCHPVAHRSLPLGTLITTTFPPNLLSSGKAALLTTRLLKQCVVVTSEEAVSLLWSDCREQHECLQLRPGDLEQLEFLGRAEVVVPDPYSRLVEGLTEQIGSANVTNEDIFNWIESKCSAEVRSTRMFIRSLTTAIVQAAVTGKGSSARYTEELFLKRLITLTKYVNSDTNLELEVLLALQVAVTKLDHPPKLLCQMFNAVYDCEVVTENTCYVWRDQEQGVEGKGTAVMSVKPFFDWLDSAERESDPEDTSQARPT